MKLNLTKLDNHTYQVTENGRITGSINLYRNLFHDSCIYLNFNLKDYPAFLPFYIIRQKEKKPLQVMTSSDDINLTNFLIANKFICERKCYEAKVTKSDLINPRLVPSSKIYRFNEQDEIFPSLCFQLYHYYKKIHAAISPLTASYHDFIIEVPTKTGYFDLSPTESIQNIIFTENNEIAYTVSNNYDSFSNFKNAVLTHLFKKYQMIFFEADNVDPVAMNLLNTFKIDKSISFDTYIFH